MIRPLLVVALAAGLLACDTGDGTTLREPTTSTTLPPADTAPLPSVAVTDAGGGDDALPGSVVIEPLPTASAPAADDGASSVLDLTLFAPWADGGPVEARHGCDGGDVAPALSWIGVPDGTSELAVALVDETNTSNGRPFIHWVMAGIDPAAGGLAEGEVPSGAVQGLNFFGDVAYAGPCPEPGTTATYRLTLYAVGQQIELTDGAPAADLLDLVETVAVASSAVVGTSSR